jgi:hypothetical protein
MHPGSLPSLPVLKFKLNGFNNFRQQSRVIDTYDAERKNKNEVRIALRICRTQKRLLCSEPSSDFSERRLGQTTSGGRASSAPVSIIWNRSNVEAIDIAEEILKYSRKIAKEVLDICNVFSFMQGLERVQESDAPIFPVLIMHTRDGITECL